MGARPMRRLIQREIEDVLAIKIINGECSRGDVVSVEFKNSKLQIKIAEKLYGGPVANSTDELLNPVVGSRACMYYYVYMIRAFV